MKTSITRITLQGFKSFNKRISIPFLPGFNVIAGPNGSGKSNIIDAVSFVLGRTSAKSLRADRLHELIFHGGEGKTAADYAAITLYLDNTQKIFPIEDEEVSVSRKVNRSGVSAYKFNGKTETREKILQTLSAARIFPDGHNIILQGDVTQIIDMNPIERRYVIDEISGIAEYNDKKEKAQKDLDVVDQKLKEAEIVISQRYDIYKKLEDERNAAIRYQNLQQQLKVLKASYAHKKFSTLDEQSKKLLDGIEKKEELNKKLISEQEEIENALEQREGEIREVADKLIDMSKRVEIEKEISELRSRLLINKDKIASNTREIERLDSLVDKLEAFESRKTELAGQIPRAVQTILRLNLKGIQGTVAQSISVPEKYQTAIEVAAGHHLYDLIADDDETAKYAIGYLKREKIGRATFLPLNKIRPMFFKDAELLKKTGVIGIASRLIKYESRFSAAMEFVFGNTLIVENLDCAQAVGIGRARMVTLDGDLVERSGAMIGGHYVKTHPKFIEGATDKDIERYRNLRKELEQEINLLKEEAIELEKKLNKYADSESAKEFIGLEKLRITSEKEVDELRDRRKKNQERRVNLEIELNRSRIEKARVDAELETFKTEVQSYGEIQYVDESLLSLEKFLKKTEAELQTIGLVNMKAIEEYEKFKNEFEGYKQKYEKILEEKKAVLEMVDQIEQKRKEVFRKCLDEISKNFSSIFSKMAGGTSKLELENMEDLESGLLIEASPRGKILLNIDSMSGGEKTLTALAFLFAVQNYKPAPFYIFDEVDAALDKENSLKLAQLIKDLSKNEQFVMITHNDQIIKAADRVYGVTMERSESKILGLELPKK